MPRDADVQGRDDLIREVGELGARVSDLERRLGNVDDHLRILADKLDGVRMDLHAAKVGGRWLIGVAIAFGSVLGWVVQLWWNRR